MVFIDNFSMGQRRRWNPKEEGKIPLEKWNSKKKGTRLLSSTGATENKMDQFAFLHRSEPLAGSWPRMLLPAVKKIRLLLQSSERHRWPVVKSILLTRCPLWYCATGLPPSPPPPTWPIKVFFSLPTCSIKVIIIIFFLCPPPSPTPALHPPHPCPCTWP